MKRLITMLFMLMLIPLSCSAISLDEIQSKPEQYKNIIETSTGTVYVDINSIKSLRYAPPYYTLQTKSYFAIYNLSCISEQTINFSYDYSRSLNSLIKKVDRENPTKSTDEKINLIYQEASKDCGVIQSIVKADNYELDGKFITKGDTEYNLKVNYNKGVFNIANYIFRKAYDEDFLPA